MWSPERYKESAVIAEEAGEGLFARLGYMLAKPAVVLDLGCGIGSFGKRLQQHFPDAQVIGIDNAMAMLAATEMASVCASGERLPLRDQQVDLIFANLLIPWCADMEVCLREWRRVLRPNGLIIFSAFGRDTLHELAGNDQLRSCPALLDMHDVGDALLKAGFAEPVLDVERITLTYRSLDTLLRELQDTNMVPTDISIEQLQHLTPQQDNLYHVTFEIIYAHGFVLAATGFTAQKDGVTHIPLEYLRANLGKSNKTSS